MNELYNLSTELEAAFAQNRSQVMHLGSRNIAYRTAVHWAGKFWVSLAEEASRGESVPLFSDGTHSIATVKAFDAVTGLVLLEIPTEHSQGVADYQDSTVGVGALALTIAYPSPDGPEASLGVVRIRPTAENYFQTDANLFQGFAGALVVDSQNRFAGLVAQEGRGNRGWVLPATRVRQRLTALQTFGDLRMPRLGVVLESIDLQTKNTNLPDYSRGVLIREVKPGSAADLAGLHQGDIIVAVGGRAVESPAAFIEVLAALTVDSPVNLIRIRGGESLTVEVKPDYRLETPQA